MGQGTDAMIRFENVSFSYGALQGQRLVQAVRDVSFSIKKGTHVALVGRNGSGKSTLARLMNGLLLPDEGLIFVDGKRTVDEESLYQIRKQCGMVFQNPDNQIIGTTVKDDVAFGLCNLGLAVDDILSRIDEALLNTGLSEYKDRAPHELSGGQKQKLAIASVLAMQPDCVILDEATAMLDPASRREIMGLVLKLKQSHDLTIVQITHDMEEALVADYIYVISDGRVAFEGTPAQVFEQDECIRREGLAMPAHLAIAHLIREQTGVPYNREEIVTFDGSVGYVRRALTQHNKQYPVKEPTVAATGAIAQPPDREKQDGPEVIQVRGLSYTYGTEIGAPIEALNDVTLSVRRGEVVGIVGHTGSGKSTLIQHLNGLIPSAAGTVIVLGQDLSRRKVIRRIRRHVGLLFQYPEDQLFEETVALDIAFAPKQQKRSPEEVERAVLRAAERVGVTSILDRSPFELSGGQRRRVAIAGVLSAEPDILILDEPTAGLDPGGRDALFYDLMTLADEGATLVIVSHDMELMARYTDRMIVLKEGRIVGRGTPEEITSSQAFLEETKLDVPAPKRFLDEFRGTYPSLRTFSSNARDAARALMAASQSAARQGGSHG
ncbi:MAG TPA: energy-coupling factor transporter ATPase [Clostridia bacterium]|nr:energy-coupling factor transporter ATPase [Clostridia bacterium]